MKRRKRKKIARRYIEDGRSKAIAPRYSALPPLYGRDNRSPLAREAGQYTSKVSWQSGKLAVYTRSMHTSQGLAQQPPFLTSGRC